MSPPFCQACNVRHAAPLSPLCTTCAAIIRAGGDPAPELPAVPPPADPPRPDGMMRIEPGGYLAFILRWFHRRRTFALTTSATPTPTPPGESPVGVVNTRVVTQSTPGLGVLQPDRASAVLLRPSPTNDDAPEPLATVGSAIRAGRTA